MASLKGFGLPCAAFSAAIRGAAAATTLCLDPPRRFAANKRVFPAAHRLKKHFSRRISKKITKRLRTFCRNAYFCREFVPKGMKTSLFFPLMKSMTPHIAPFATLLPAVATRLSDIGSLLPPPFAFVNAIKSVSFRPEQGGGKTMPLRRSSATEAICRMPAWGLHTFIQLT